MLVLVLVLVLVLKEIFWLGKGSKEKKNRRGGKGEEEGMSEWC